MMAIARPWFRSAFQLRGSVIPATLPRAIVCGLFGLLVSVFYAWGWPVYLPVLVSIIPNIVLGLMLVFRTNTAYERYWEGRKLWGNLINSTRNLARQVWVIVQEKSPQDTQEKQEILQMLAAFAVATKLHLRNEPVNEELQGLLPDVCYQKLKLMNNPPLEIAFWISDFLQTKFQEGKINVYQLNGMQELVSFLVNCLGGCERILKTPIPLAYAIHLKQLLLLYCFTLPFQIVEQLDFWTGPMVALVSFTLLGIEEIGLEIENPFGSDFNDLPLNAICQTIQKNIQDITSLEPTSARFHQLEQTWETPKTVT